MRPYICTGFSGKSIHIYIFIMVIFISSNRATLITALQTKFHKYKKNSKLSF